MRQTDSCINHQPSIFHQRHHSAACFSAKIFVSIGWPDLSSPQFVLKFFYCLEKAGGGGRVSWVAFFALEKNRDRLGIRELWQLAAACLNLPWLMKFTETMIKISA